MIQFRVPKDRQFLDAQLVVDGEGHLCLELDGVEVLFISSEEGILVRTYIDPKDCEKLRAAGLSVDEQRIVYEETPWRSS